MSYGSHAACHRSSSNTVLRLPLYSCKRKVSRKGGEMQKKKNTNIFLSVSASVYFFF